MEELSIIGPAQGGRGGSGGGRGGKRMLNPLRGCCSSSPPPHRADSPARSSPVSCRHRVDSWCQLAGSRACCSGCSLLCLSPPPQQSEKQKHQLWTIKKMFPFIHWLTETLNLLEICPSTLSCHYSSSVMFTQYPFVRCLGALHYSDNYVFTLINLHPLLWVHHRHFPCFSRESQCLE